MNKEEQKAWNEMEWRNKQRLEQIRKSIEAESISFDEIVELESLVDWIESGDVQLLEWAGVPEFQK